MTSQAARWPGIFFTLAFALFSSGCANRPDAVDPVTQAVADPHRTAAFVARDNSRHPAETLAFFAVEPSMSVVEIWPGAGWYTEILAPLLRDQGQLYAAHFDPASSVAFFQRSLAAFQNKLAATPELYGHVTLTTFNPPAETAIAPAGSADRVLTFRNVHNWAKGGHTEAAFAAFFAALKPGGILGVVEHRAPAGRALPEQIATGYMTEEYVIGQAEQAGFQLMERTEINANPQDTADHPAGVWSLPPTLRDVDGSDRSHYQRIGESDRMTLKFIKPR